MDLDKDIENIIDKGSDKIIEKGVERIMDYMHYDEKDHVGSVVERMGIDPFDITPYHYSKISTIVMEHEGEILKHHSEMMDFIEEYHKKINEERENTKQKLIALLTSYVDRSSNCKQKQNKQQPNKQKKSQEQGYKSVLSYIKEQEHKVKLQHIEKESEEHE